MVNDMVKELYPFQMEVVMTGNLRKVNFMVLGF